MVALRYNICPSGIDCSANPREALQCDIRKCRRERGFSERRRRSLRTRVETVSGTRRTLCRYKRVSHSYSCFLWGSPSGFCTWDVPRHGKCELIFRIVTRRRRNAIELRRWCVSLLSFCLPRRNWRTGLEWYTQSLRKAHNRKTCQSELLKRYAKWRMQMSELALTRPSAHA